MALMRGATGREFAPYAGRADAYRRCVRNGANAIYSGASEIATGNTISLRAPSNRLLRWKRRQPAGATDRNGETERRECAPGQPPALSASETAQRGGKVVDNVVRLCVISPPVRRKSPILSA